ncbi:MAG: hypothetical protein QGI09_03220 [Dehalococcoidia bacterium]|jgi:hypothetical protein|nr:hypothetical protein [Dehalococcoidia bacterium]
MIHSEEINKLRQEYSASMAAYQAAVDALRQFDQELFDGLVLDFETIVQEGQNLKSQESAAYKRMSRAREAYGQLPH